MDTTLIIVLIGYVLFACSLIAIPIKRKMIMNKAGKLLYGFPKKRIGYIIGIEVLSVVLITLFFFIRYSFFVTLVLCACGVLGSWIIVGEAALGAKYGLYENGIVAIGKYIPYDDIVTFPVLNLPTKDQQNHPQNVLVISCRKYGNIEIAFDSDEICHDVIKTLRKMGYVK